MIKQNTRRGLDLTGETYDHFFVVKQVQNVGKKRMWLVRCVDCGHEKTLPTRYLREGKGHCICRPRRVGKRGPYHRHVAANKKRIDHNAIIGQRFGRLVVLELTEFCQSIPIYKCRCDCEDRECYVGGPQLRRGATKSCGCLRRQHASKLGKRRWIGHEVSHP